MWAYWLRHQKKAHSESKIRTRFPTTTLHTTSATPTVVLNCSLKSISSNYLRHNFSFIVDQSVNFTFSYPPLWLCWWAVSWTQRQFLATFGGGGKATRKTRKALIDTIPSTDSSISDIYGRLFFAFSHDYHQHRHRSQLYNPRKSLETRGDRFSILVKTNHRGKA